MASGSARSTAEYVTDTSGSYVQIVASFVDLMGEATAWSHGPPCHVSAHSVPVVSVRSASGRDQDSLHASSIQDAISVQSSHISSTHGQSSSDDEETAQARMEAAPAAQEVANQRLACIRVKKQLALFAGIVRRRSDVPSAWISRISTDGPRARPRTSPT